MALATLASAISEGFTAFSDVPIEVCLKLRRYLVMSIDCAQSQDSVSTAEKWHCPPPLVPFLFIELSFFYFSCLFLNSNWWWITFGSTSCSNSWEMALVGVASASSWALAQDQEVLALSSEVIWQWWLSALLAQNFSGHPNFGTCHGVEGKPWGKSCSPEAHQLVHWDVQWIWQPRNGWCSGLQLRPQYRDMLFEWSNCIFTWVTVSVDSLEVPTWWTSSGRTMELFAVPFMTRWFAFSLLFSLSDVQQLWLCRCHQQKGVQRRLSYNLGCWALDQISASKEPRRVCMCSGSCKSSLKSHTTQSKIPLVSASRIWTLGPTSTRSQWPSQMGTPKSSPWSSSWLLPSMCLWQTLSWNLFTLSLQHATASGVFIRLQVMLRLTSSIALQRSSVNHQGQDQTQFSVRSCFARWDGWNLEWGDWWAYPGVQWWQWRGTQEGFSLGGLCD